MSHEEAACAAKSEPASGSTPPLVADALLIGELVTHLRTIRTEAQAARDQVARLFEMRDLESFEAIEAAANRWIGRLMALWDQQSKA